MSRLSLGLSELNLLVSHIFILKDDGCVYAYNIVVVICCCFSMKWWSELLPLLIS